MFGSPVIVFFFLALVGALTRFVSWLVYCTNLDCYRAEEEILFPMHIACSKPFERNRSRRETLIGISVISSVGLLRVLSRTEERNAGFQFTFLEFGTQSLR